MPHRFTIGPWFLDSELNTATREGRIIRLEPKVMEVCAYLADREGEVVRKEELIRAVWPDTFVTDDALTHSISELRKALEDDAKNPKFIETIPKRGYHLIAPVERWDENAAPLPKAKREPQAHRTKQWLLAAWASVAAVLIFAAAFVGWRLYHLPRNALSFAARDWVLISSFENRTGEPVLDGTLEYALERELSNSQFVNVVPRERVGDVLRLMKKPLDTKIDAALGREICLRDGGIRALLTGRVEKLGTTYVLSAQLVNPVDGVTVASMSEEDPAESQMAVAVRRLSSRVRERLGEKRAPIQQSEKRLEKVTTPSLHALQLYSQADELMRLDDNQAAGAELLERAIAEDPGFASAHLLLGYAYENRGKHETARPEFQRAFDLAGTTTDRERLFILASYYHLVQEDAPKAVEAYEALLRLYPDHYWGGNNLFHEYRRVGRPDDMWRLAARLADSRPDALPENALAGCGKTLQEDANGARPYLERASALASADPNATDPNSLTTNLGLLPVFQSWSTGNVTQARAELKEFDSKQRKVEEGQITFVYLALGEFREAERRIRRVPYEDEQSYLLASLAFLRGDLQSARNSFERMKIDLTRDPSGTAIVLAGRCGLWNKAGENPHEIARGEHALAQGQTKEGIALLEKGIENPRRIPTGAFYLGSESLARAYQEQGKPDDALRVLQQASNTKRRAYDCVDGGDGDSMLGAWWLRTEIQLADLYRTMGRVPEAEQVETELRKILVYADADHPIVRELQKRRSPLL